METASPGSRTLCDDSLVIALGSAERRGVTAFIVTNRMWRQFGDWSHLDVTALLSHAYFKAYTTASASIPSIQ